MPVPTVCVECRRAPVDPMWRPFCSERCRNLDLARWVDGSYRVPAEPVPDAESGDDGQ
ncbi:MAG: DNA gyrase inhibitor YacG [Vicinamibacterales bacterium]